MTAYEFTYMVTCGQVDQTRVPESRPPHDCFPHRHRIAVIAAVVEWVEEGSEEECREKGLRTGSHISWYRMCRRNASFVGTFSAAFMTDRLSVQRHARDL